MPGSCSGTGSPTRSARHTPTRVRSSCMPQGTATCRTRRRSRCSRARSGWRRCSSPGSPTVRAAARSCSMRSSLAAVQSITFVAMEVGERLASGASLHGLAHGPCSRSASRGRSPWPSSARACCGRPTARRGGRGAVPASPRPPLPRPLVDRRGRSVRRPAPSRRSGRPRAGLLPPSPEPLASTPRRPRHARATWPCVSGKHLGKEHHMRRSIVTSPRSARPSPA